MSLPRVKERFDRIDILRALAMVWMTVYHFCYDLDYFGLIEQDIFGDPFWTTQRTIILGTFLFTAGLSQAVALEQGQGWARFWRRWWQVAGAAMLVTLATMVMFPRSFIFFGVLHGIAVMLIVVRLTAHWGQWLWLAGAGCVAAARYAPLALENSSWRDLFDGPMLNWLGWVTHKPVTEDYVPLLPWLAAIWWGMAAGQWILRHQPQWLGGQGAGSITSPLAVMGRWSLTYYLLHQPIMIGCLWLGLQLS
ncbi:heparan-alpha-glucosaminide N-acetyltransferase [Hydrogenophaga sp. 5NK40-0174]|uniref:DUF1624 domain-containing protein n=1 Tax=Hydrogenophaga sp. 5NK40-0174 TaxID=3127649 RepID=UPI003102C34E